MTDTNSGMEGSEHRFLKATRMVAAGALLAGVVAVAGCGGGGDKSAAPVPPVTQSANPGGVVGAEGTKGLVGPADRSSSKGSSFTTKTAKIPPNSNHKTNGQKGVGANEACADAGTTPTSSNLPAINAAILCLVNSERANAGLPKLESNSKLQQAAEGMAAQMVSQHFFSHETPDGKNVVDRVEPTGYIPDSGDWVVGENLAWGSGALSTPQAIVNGWMNSPGHKANILATDYKDVGLAAALGSPSPSQSGGTTYVNDFGATSGADTSTTLPPESGAENGSGDSGTTGDSASTASADGDQTTAGTKSTAKKKKKAKHKKKRRHKRRH